MDNRQTEGRRSVKYEEYLEEHGELTYKFRGVSMLPLLRQEKDFITVLKKTDKRCSKYDVVLYRRPPGQYVLHRIVEVRESDYVILGDNCLNKEYGITDDDIIGVMSEYIRNGRTCSVNNNFYKAYSRIWYGIYPIRRAIKLLRMKLGKLVKK